MSPTELPSVDEGSEEEPRLAVVPPRPVVDRWSQPREADGTYVALARRELPALTSLRFFAAFYVVVHHLINVGLLHTQGAEADRAANWYLAWGTQGHVGVTFFFVLSGFILAWCYHRSFASDRLDASAATSRKFWFARFARVWPLHAVMFLAFVPLALLDVGVSITGLFTTAWHGVSNVLLLHAWLPIGGPDGLSDTFNGPSWTLSDEAFFYLAFPILAVWIVGKLRWGVAQLGLLIAATWVTLGLVGVALDSSGARGDWAMRVFPPIRLADFVIGIAIGLIVVQGLQRSRLLEREQASSSSARWTMLEIGVLGAACASPLVWALSASHHLPSTLGMSWFHLPAIVAAIYVVSLERGAISRRLLALRPLVWLGEISYALYLTHLFMILGAYRFGAYDRLGAWPTSLVLIVASLAVAGVVHERFEKPVRSWLVARRARRG